MTSCNSTSRRQPGAARRRQRRRRRDRGGTATLEFALVLPVLISIVLGCVDFGRFAYAYISATNAARAGANWGATHRFLPSNYALWQERVRRAVLTELGPAFDPDDVTVPTPVVTGDSDGTRRVRVAVDVNFQTLVGWPLLPGGANLHREVEMRIVLP